MTRRFVLALTVVLAGSVVPLALPSNAGAGEVACGGFSSAYGRCVNTQLSVGGTSYNVDWYLPNGSASALMLLQHGFSRGCGNLRNTSKAIMEKGVMVLCINADMSGGNQALGVQLGDLLNSRAVAPPAGKSLPRNYIVGGHSAGGHFASVVGARLAGRGYPDLKGAILADAVAADGFSSNLQAISAGGTRRVLEVAARPSAINMFNNSFGALTGLPSGFVGVQLVWSGYFLGVPYGGSCHTDVEGDNGDVVGNLAAGCTPSSFQYGKLRELFGNWARDMGTGTSTSAYYCTDKANVATCGSKVKELVTGLLPRSALIR